MDWFRWHAGTTTDAKWRVVAAEAGQPLCAVIATWGRILEHANEATPRGTLAGWQDRIAAAALDLTPDAVRAIREAMQGLVLDGDKLSGWKKRQVARERDDDLSTERVRRHREQKKGAGANETPCNATQRQETPRAEQNRTELFAACCPREDEADESGAPPPEPPAPAAEAAPASPSAAPTAEDMLELVTTANAAMRQNTAIDQHRLRPIPENHAGSFQVIADWMRDGISLEAAASVIQRVAQKEFRPSGNSKQINSLAYFDGAVREAHALATGAPRRKHGTGGLPRRSPRPEEYVGSTEAADWSS